ncbi:MAG TPA: hypothetical protein VFW44_04425 [Bryobacteraceae bacterium]|nr:hypothetical protein [Bryobacteraceae bacterium]
MKSSLGLPAECIGCRAQTVLRINGQPVCLECAEQEPPAAHVVALVLGEA